MEIWRLHLKFRQENKSGVKKVRRIWPLLRGRAACSPEENFENFIFKSINQMHFERKIKQNYKTVWKYNKHGHTMLYKKRDWLTDLSLEIRNSTTLTQKPQTTEWKKQTLKECGLTRWIWVLKRLLSLCLKERCWLQCVDAMTCTFFLYTFVWQCACSAWLPLFAMLIAVFKLDSKPPIWPSFLRLGPRI